ncbi:helix-turn-helix transcriptional regulator [Phytoactinopolyspora endophytica]|uniref:helix-turn-helix transcriptional regulator n=1 Tax=Phytoactinopolyspora endophytica TaxID=1642495 RepID=UPI00101DFCFB|nr:LuxR C-terminal-related transcriptional regulator [Phytoactinopolyspora endophytica]
MNGIHPPQQAASYDDVLRWLSGVSARLTSPPIHVVESKLHAPPLRVGMVSRRALIDRLESSPAPVVAVHAAAGYGKTTLLSEWSQVRNAAAAWVSLDGGDNDPAVLLAHIAVALDRIEPLSPMLFAAFASNGSVTSTVLPQLGSALAAMRAPVLLFLDDAHNLVNHACLDVIAQLAQRLPRASKLVVTARNVLALPLARWRANGVVAEADSSDLALDADEACRLLRNTGVGVSDEAVAELARKTEGWPAGLCLAALSFAAEDGRRHSSAFTGSDRFVADYVHSEVLAQLPDDLVRFLMHTAVLDRMCGSLCDAVLERTGSSQVLTSIENSNVFLVPLDHQREWYRYHHLFRDVLMARLAAYEPDLVPTLHRRAGDWCEQRGMLEEAFHHASCAADDDRAASLLEQLAPRLYRTGRVEALQVWLARLDEKAIERRPLLAVVAGSAAALTGDAIGAAWWAEIAEKSSLVKRPLEAGTSVVPALHLLRALTCRGGVKQMRKDAEAAVHLEPETSPGWPAALMVYGIGSFLSGDGESADRALADAVDAAERIGSVTTSSVALAERSLLAMSRGDWVSADLFAQRARSSISIGGLEAYLPSSIVFAVSARTALRHGDRVLARREAIRAHWQCSVLCRSVPWLAAQTMIQSSRVQLELSERAGTRKLISEARDVIARMPDVGTLGDQLADLQRRLWQIPRADAAGPTSLTAAELRLLPSLSTHLSFREIGELFHLSPNTIKTQAISIYRKLGVSARTDAVLRAREVGLLEEWR